MNKSELSAVVVDKSAITKKDAEKAVNAVFDTIAEALAGGDKVTLVSFGTFEVRDRAARTGRNPQTGEPMEIAASKNPAFTTGKSLKDTVAK